MIHSKKFITKDSFISLHTYVPDYTSHSYLNHYWFYSYDLKYLLYEWVVATVYPEIVAAEKSRLTMLNYILPQLRKVQYNVKLHHTLSITSPLTHLFSYTNHGIGVLMSKRGHIKAKIFGGMICGLSSAIF